MLRIEISVETYHRVPQRATYADSTVLLPVVLEYLNSTIAGLAASTGKL